MDSLTTLYRYIGPAGVALILLSLLCLYLSVKMAVIIKLTGKSFNKAANIINNDSAGQEKVIAENLDNPIVAIINEVIKTHGNHSNDIKAEVAYLFNLHFSSIMRDITLIKVSGVIAPLLGLLGTLLGLMGVFGVLSEGTSLSTSTVLAAGIWEAIITTIMGLSLAIPAMVVYHIFRLRIKTFYLATIEYSYRFFECSCNSNGANNFNLHKGGMA